MSEPYVDEVFIRMITRERLLKLGTSLVYPKGLRTLLTL